MSQLSFSGHASQATISSVTIVFTTIACIVIGARLLTRVFVSKQTGLDDAFISIAGVCSVIMGVAICKQADYGMGLHMYQVSDYGKSVVTKYFWLTLWIYYGAMGFTKLSILVQYLRIFPQLPLVRSCYAMIVVVVVFNVWAFFSGIFMCRPIPVFWHSLDLFDHRCLPRLTTWYVNAAINILTDIIIAVMPLPVINSLEIPRRQKNLLLIVFGMGLCTCVVSVFRLTFLWPLSNSPDMSWESPLNNVFAGLEVNVAIMCSCLPTLKGFVQRYYPKLLDSLNSVRKSSRGSSNANGSVSSTSKLSLFKNKTYVEEVDPESGLQLSDKPSRLGFRRSFFSSPFSTTGSSQRGLVGKDSNGSSDEDTLFDPIATKGTTKSGNTLLSQISELDKEISVTTTMTQVCELRGDDVEEEHPALRSLPERMADPDRHESLAESTRTLVSRGEQLRSFPSDLHLKDVEEQ